MGKQYLTHEECSLSAGRLAVIMMDQIPKHHTINLFPVPRGGIPAAYLVMAAIVSAGRRCRIATLLSGADYVVDDLVDSGATRLRYADKTPVPFVALFTKSEEDDDWIVFPWEKGEDDLDGAEDIPLRLLQFIGEDVDRGGLKETPDRFLKAWEFWTSGYERKPSEILKVFEDGAEDYDQMVLVRDIPVYSHCEHHLAPIFGVAHVAYIPDGSICGLSKLNRLVDVFARRLQVQERLTAQIADSLCEHLKPLGAAVQLKCRHLCMESRGICQQGHVTITSALRGAIKDEPDARAEFMKLCE